MPRADLHVHSSASDGQQSTAEILQLARQQALDAVAITDHDTTAGLRGFNSAVDLTLVPGIELGAIDQGQRIDILGYYIDIDNSDLQAALARFQANRKDRGQQIVAALDNIGVHLEWAQVVALAGREAVGRPHIARALVEAGHAEDVPDAFARYIGEGGPAYVARLTLSPEAAVELIHAAGGVAVLAHPVYVTDFPQMVERLVPAGLDGIEVCYPAHTQELETQARQLALKYDLVMTGGSDFHGLDAPGKAMLGSTLAPEGGVEALRARSARYGR